MSAAKAAARPPEAGIAYGDDFDNWIREQGARLRAGDLAGLDLAKLAEEIGSLGRSALNSLVNAWRVILMHRLRWDHQPERRSRSWALSIRTHREPAADVPADDPGLQPRLTEALDGACRGARLEAANESGLPLKAFPRECPDAREEMPTCPFPVDPDDAAD